MAGAISTSTRKGRSRRITISRFLYPEPGPEPVQEQEDRQNG
jgi:hypothetical protein